MGSSWGARVALHAERGTCAPNPGWDSNPHSNKTAFKQHWHYSQQPFCALIGCEKQEKWCKKNSHKASVDHQVKGSTLNSGRHFSLKYIQYTHSTQCHNTHINTIFYTQFILVHQNTHRIQIYMQYTHTRAVCTHHSISQHTQRKHTVHNINIVYTKYKQRAHYTHSTQSTLHSS